MDITSIDNVYEEDGLVLVQGFLAGLNAEEAGPSRQLLVAIIPEYERPADPHDVGRLLRLDAITINHEDPGELTIEDAELLEAIGVTVQRLQMKRAAALKKLDDEPPIVVTHGR